MSLILVLFFKCQDSVASLFYSLCTLEHGEVCHRPNSLPSSFSSPSTYLKCETLEPVKKVKASKTFFGPERDLGRQLLICNYSSPHHRCI